jgi:hypothetical protein
MDIGDGDVGLQVPEDFKGHLNGELGLDGKERVPTPSSGQGDRGIDDHLGVGGGRHLWIAGEIDGMWRSPKHAFPLRSGLQKHQVTAPVKVGGHPDQDFPVESFLIEANPSPVFHVLEDLVGDGIDPGLGFAGASPPGDEPSPDKILHRPGKPSETHHDISGMGLAEEAPCSEKCAQDNHSPRVGSNEQKVPRYSPGNTAEEDDQISDPHPWSSERTF